MQYLSLFFGIVSRESQISDYTFNTFIGFGTGGFGAIDTVETVDSLATEPASTNAGVFFGTIFNTPFLDKWGGIDIVGEFDGNGIKIGRASCRERV